MSYTMKFNNIFVQSTGTVVGKLEYEGPLGEYFDDRRDNDYCGKKSFEDGEVQFSKEAIAYALRKAKLNQSDIKVAIGGDLSNQIAVSNFVANELPFAFLGVYGACSTATLSIGVAAMFCELNKDAFALAFTSSNYATAERQFRYPIEYGIQKKETTTTTVTGGGAIVLGSRPSKVRVSAVTFGNVKDAEWLNVNDMGSPMALAAYDTIKHHLFNMKETPDDYDLILTGDLSSVGSEILKDALALDGIILKNHDDAGKLIYDPKKQNVYCGGSGTGCMALVAYSYVMKKLTQGEYKRVLLVATGALFSTTFCFQKHSIPIIAHAVVLEANV